MDQKLLTFIYSIADSTVMIVSSRSQLNTVFIISSSVAKEIRFWIRPQNTQLLTEHCKSPQIWQQHKCIMLTSLPLQDGDKFFLYSVCTHISLFNNRRLVEIPIIGNIHTTGLDKDRQCIQCFVHVFCSQLEVACSTAPRGKFEIEHQYPVCCRSTGILHLNQLVLTSFSFPQMAMFSNE